MTRTNVEVLNRAIGMIEGVSFAAPDKLQNALSCVADMLEGILNDPKEEETKKEFAVRPK